MLTSLRAQSCKLLSTLNSQYELNTLHGRAVTFHQAFNVVMARINLKRYELRRVHFELVICTIALPWS